MEEMEPEVWSWDETQGLPKNCLQCSFVEIGMQGDHKSLTGAIGGEAAELGMAAVLVVEVKLNERRMART